MTRAPYFFGFLVVASGALAPGCGGSEFTADAGDPSDAGESATGGNGDSGGGLGGSSSGTAGTDAGGSDVGGNGNGGASGKGGNGGTSTGGSPMGGDAGEGATGGSGPGGMGGSSGASTGGAGSGGKGGTGGAGSGGRGGTSGAGSGAGGTGGAGSGGKGGTGGAGSGGKGGTGGGGSGAGGKGGSGGAGPSTCPPGPPSPNSACSFMGHCSYGTHPRHACRDVYACDGVRWQQTQDANCPTPPSCESLPTPPVINAMCAPEGAECKSNFYCLCAANCTTVCSLPAIWHCFGTAGSCPDVLPNRGQPCNVSLSCVYGSCATQTGVQAICDNGYWVWNFLDCPQ